VLFAVLGTANAGAYVYPGLANPLSLGSDGTYLYRADASGGPIAVAVDAAVNPTTVSVSCLYSIVAPGATTTCTATVSDTASTTKPTGTVTFSAGSGATEIGNPCTLGTLAGVTSCAVGVVPVAQNSSLTVTATYSGDSVHQGASGSRTICAGAPSQCSPPPPPSGTTRGNTPPPGSSPKQCVVPKLVNYSLATARKRLTAAHCKLGKVRNPKFRKGRKKPALVVGRQRIKAGTHRKSGTAVALAMKVKPKPKPKPKRT